MADVSSRRAAARTAPASGPSGGSWHCGSPAGGGPHRIAAHLHLARSTVGKDLARCRMPRLAPVRKPAPQRYEHDHPGA
jgi:hypothetical protein